MKANLLIGVWVVVGSDVVDVILPITKVKGINECLFWLIIIYWCLKLSNIFLNLCLLEQSVILGCKGPPIDWQTLSLESYK